MLGREELKQKVSDMFVKQFNVNLMELPEDTPLPSLQKLNEKLDSLQVLEFLFDVEDQLGFKFGNEGEDESPKVLKDIYDTVYRGYLKSIESNQNDISSE
jgi:acyl carrier protein